MTPANFRAQNTLFGPMFVEVGTQSESSQGSYDVQTLKPSGESVPNGQTCVAGVDTITLVKLSATGSAGSDMLCWRDSKGELWGGRSKQAYCGWYTATGTTPATLTIEAGEAVWINVPGGASVTFTVAGEVPAGDILMALRKGNTAVCNPQPVAMDVQNVKPVAAPETTVPNGETCVAGVDTITLVKLSATGGAGSDMLCWRDSNGALWGGRSKQAYYGWYTATGTTPAELEIAPGEGVWVNAPVNTTSLLFPSPLNKDEE